MMHGMTTEAASFIAQVRLHGEPVLVLANGQVVGLERRAAALLALAALDPGITRLRTAALLWPDSDDARGNLRQQLLRFRRLAGQDLLQGGDSLRLADGVVLEPGQAGTLLGTLNFDDCEAFAAWLSSQRDGELKARVGELRVQLAEAEAAGRLEAALDAAQALLALDDRDELHHRECMRLHYLAGNGAAGLAAFERLSRMLNQEFGSRPSAASVQLADALRLAQEGVVLRSSQAPSPLTLPVTLKRPPRVAGRDAERAAVRLALADGRAVWIEGEAGMGKTRLLGAVLQEWGASGGAEATTPDAAIRHAAHQGLAPQGVLMGAGRPGDAGSPYATLGRLVMPLAGRTRPRLSASAQHALRCLDPHDADPASPAIAHHAMAAAVAELIERSSVDAVVLDDLHFADEATLELLAALMSREPPEQSAPGHTTTRWLFATRPAEVPASGRAMRAALTELQRLVVVTLSPLGAGDVAALVDSLGIAGLTGQALAEPLVRHTGGNPLFMLETLKQGLADGSLARGQLPRPSQVATLMEARLSRLSDGALTLARVAAIAGVDFCIELAESAIGLHAVLLAGAWHELQEAQILRDEAFAHDLIADAVMRGVPPVVARRVHAQCAAWLDGQPGDPARVARHWLAGGRPAEAGRAFASAARRAEQAARLQEQAAFLAQAAEAFGQAGLQEERFDALCGRTRALISVDLSTAALEEARAAVGEAATDAQRMRAQTELLGLLVERGESEAAIDAGRSLMALARRLDDRDRMVRTACHMASALCRLGRADESLELLLPLRAWVDEQPDDALRMLWHGDWAVTLGNLGRLREAVQAYESARAAARRAGLADAEGRLMMNCAVTLRQSGRFDQALALAREGQARSAQDSNDATHRAIGRLVIARDEIDTGCYGPALASLEDVLAQFESTRAGFWSHATRMVLSNLWLVLGQPSRAVRLLDHDGPDVPPWLLADRQLLRLDLALATQQRPPPGALQLALAHAGSDAQRGPWLRVRALRHLPAEQVLADGAALQAELATTERYGVAMALQVHLARSAVAVGQVAVAERAAELLLAQFAKGIAPDAVYRAEAWWVASRAFKAAGRPGEAEAALKQGAQWISQQALPHVPPPFIDSFLHRNPVNAELLAAASSA